MKHKRIESLAPKALALVAEYWKQRSVVLSEESKLREIEAALLRFGVSPTAMPWELESGRTVIGFACEAFCSSAELRSEGGGVGVGERALCGLHRHGQGRGRVALVESVERNEPALAAAVHAAWTASDEERPGALAVLQDLLLSRGDMNAREKGLEEITDEVLEVERKRVSPPQVAPAPVEPPEVF